MGERGLQQRNKNEKIKKMGGIKDRIEKVKQKREIKKKKRELSQKSNLAGISDKKTKFKKESASQEKSNLLGENPVANREKDTVLMKRGHRAGIMKHMKGFAKYDHDYKKTDARIARDYAANAAYDAEHGYKSEANYEAKQAEKAMARKDGGLFSGKFGRDGLVKGTKQRKKYVRRGKQG